MLNLKNTFIISLSIVVVIFAVFIVFYFSQPKVKNIDYLQAIKIAVSTKVESEAVPCGFMPINVDPYSFNRCVIDAESKSGAYWVAYQIQGEDSIVWLLYSKLSSGSYEQKIFDSHSNIESERVNFNHVYTESCPSL